MFDWSLPLWGEGIVFLVAAGVIGIAGAKAAQFADQLADRTGLGEAVTGTVFLGFLTALPGLTASVIAALNGYPGLAIHNAMGGIARCRPPPWRLPTSPTRKPTWSMRLHPLPT